MTPIEWARAEAKRLRELTQTTLGRRASSLTVGARQFLADRGEGTTFEKEAAKVHVGGFNGDKVGRPRPELARVPQGFPAGGRAGLDRP